MPLISKIVLDKASGIHNFINATNDGNFGVTPQM